VSEEPGKKARESGQSLSSIVRGEAIRAQAETQIRSDPDRVADGWERRFVVEGRRAAEYLELYSSLGFDVVADPVQREQVGDECDDCRLALLLEFRTIYTRRRSPAG
jgi:hypothetical protein